MDSFIKWPANDVASWVGLVVAVVGIMAAVNRSPLKSIVKG